MFIVADLVSLSGISKRRPKIVFQGRFLLNAGQKYCRMLIKLPFVIKIFVLSIFEWPLKTGFTVGYIRIQNGF